MAKKNDRYNGYKWDAYSACACAEGFDGEESSEEKQLSAWQYIYDSGLYKSLQGFYGRAVQALLESGQLLAKED